MSNNQSALLKSPPGSAEPQIRELVEELYLERVIEARAMAPEEKLLAGEELFEYACSITLAGIRNQFPGASEQECLKLLEERFELRERLDKRA